MLPLFIYTIGPISGANFNPQGIYSNTVSVCFILYMASYAVPCLTMLDKLRVASHPRLSVENFADLLRNFVVKLVN